MRFYLQSLNDVVTNSSMEVYVQATDYTICSVKKIIDVVLKMGGSDKTCEDLFDIGMDYTDMFDRYFDYVCDTLEDMEDNGFKARMLEEVTRTYKEPDSERYSHLVNSGLLESEIMSIEEYTDWISEDVYINTSISILPKVTCSAEDISIMNRINSLFEVNASYDS